MKNEIKSEKNYPSANLAKIEEVRSSFVPYYKKSDRIEKILFGVGVAVIVFAWLFLPGLLPEGSLGTTLRFVFMFAPLIALIVYAVITKKAVNKRAQIFFSTYYRESNNFVFNQKGVKNLIHCEPASIEKAQFDENLLYKDVFQINSKGHCTLTYNKLNADVVDAAAMVKQNKRVAVAYTGKYLFAKSNYSGKDRLVIYLKGNGVALPPTNLEGLKTVFDNKTMIIYCTNKNWEKIISKSAMKKISQIKTNKLLVDLSISIHGGKQYICMGYDDPLMIPPFENQFDSKAVEQYKKEVAQILSLMEELA